MGKESPCRARIGGREVEGRVQLETDDLIFRGPLRLVIPLRDISSAEANGGELRIVYGPGDVAVFDIGRQAAETWAGAIRNPRGLLDKLGVKPSMAISVLGSFDREFIDDVSGRTGPVSVGRGRKDADMVFLGIERPSDLVKLEALRDSIADDGAMWAVYRKGRRGHPHRAEVRHPGGRPAVALPRIGPITG